MATSTSATIAPAVRGFYDRVLLERARPYLAHHLFGQKKPVPLKNGDQPIFRRYTALTPATAPLVEGVTPSSQSLAKTDIPGQLQQYGSFIEYSDYVSFVTEDPLLTEMAELLGENSGETLDCVYRDALAATSSMYRAGNVARASIALKLTKVEIDKILRAMAVAKAKMWMESPIAGTAAVGTTPIAAAFFAIVSPQTTYDLRNILTTDFIPVHKYPNPTSAVPGEVGSYSNLRFIESTNAKTYLGGGGSAVAQTLAYTGTNATCDVHTMLIFGKNAYGITDLAGKGLENIVKELGSGDDPLNQRGTSGWKSTTDCIILNDAFMYCYEFGVSA